MMREEIEYKVTNEGESFLDGCLHLEIAILLKLTRSQKQTSEHVPFWGRGGGGSALMRLF